MAKSKSVDDALIKALPKLLHAVEKLPESQAENFIQIRDLIIEIDDLKNLRQHCIEVTMPGYSELDIIMKNLIKDLNALRAHCEALMKQGRGSNKRQGINFWRQTTHTVSSDVIESTRKRLKQAQDQILHMLEPRTLPITLDKEKSAAMSELLRDILSLVLLPNDNKGDMTKMFGIHHMTKKQRRTVLKTNPGFASATDGADQSETLHAAVGDRAERSNMIHSLAQLKIRLIKEALDMDSPTLDIRSLIDPMQGYKPEHLDPYQRQNALLETVNLLETEYRSTAHLAILFVRADRLAWTLHSLGLRREATQLCRISHDIVRDNLSCLPGTQKGLLKQSHFTLAFCGGDLGSSKSLVEMHTAELNPDNSPSELALFQYNLSLRLVEAGKRTEALAHIREAEEMYRKLAATGGDAYRLNHASCLMYLSNRLHEQGGSSKDKSLMAIEEAVKICEPLATASANEMSHIRASYASYLNNLSLRLYERGDALKALSAIQKSVVILGELTQTIPDVFDVALADSLSNMSHQLVGAGQGKKALHLIREVVDVRRALVMKNPDVFKHDLALSLFMFSGRLRAEGQKGKALEAVQEAVSMYDKLSGASPKECNVYLANALDLLAICYMDVDEKQKALDAIARAVRMWEELVAFRPNGAEFQANLAPCLNRLAVCLHGVNRKKEAVGPIERAVTIYDNLVKTETQMKEQNVFRLCYANSLNNLSFFLHDAGRENDSLSKIEDAVGIYRALQDKPGMNNYGLASPLINPSDSLVEAVIVYRTLVQRDPEKYRPNLLTYLSNRIPLGGARSGDLSAPNELRQDVLGKRVEAKEGYKPLFQTIPSAFKPSFALSLLNYCTSLREAGRDSQALETIRDAVKIRKELNQINPAAYKSDYALSLRSLSAFLNSTGNLEEALAQMQESVKVYEDLTEKDPHKFRPDLASSLITLSLRLSDVGKNALTVSQKAVTIYRELAITDPDTYSLELAKSIDYLVYDLYNAGKRDSQECLVAMQERVLVYRDLNKTNANMHGLALASSLFSLYYALRSAGRQREALDSEREGVAILREIVKSGAEEYAHFLPSSLNALGHALLEAGKKEEALSAIQEAVAIYREQQKRDAGETGAYRSGLATSLDSLFYALSTLGKNEEALAASQEAVALYRELENAKPGAYSLGLASSLSSLSYALRDEGKDKEAVDARHEATIIYRDLARSTEAYSPNLALILNNLSYVLRDVGEKKEAFTTAQEAVEIIRALATKNPGVYQSELAYYLDTLSAALSDLGATNDALNASQESVAIWRVSGIDCLRHGEHLANLAKQLTRVGDSVAAVAIAEESAEIYRSLVQESLDFHYPGILIPLNILPICQRNVGQSNKALASSKEAVDINRRLVRWRPQVFKSYLAESLRTLSECLIASGEAHEALTSIEESVQIYRCLTQIVSAPFNRDLAESLHALSLCLLALERREEALLAIEESVSLYGPLFEQYPLFFQPLLANALREHSNCLEAVGKIKESRSAKEDSDRIRQMTSLERVGGGALCFGHWQCHMHLY